MDNNLKEGENPPSWLVTKHINNGFERVQLVGQTYLSSTSDQTLPTPSPRQIMRKNVVHKIISFSLPSPTSEFSHERDYVRNFLKRGIK